MYSKLFEKGKIGKLETKNRLVMTAMEHGLANLDGTPSEDMIAYYEARAKGGAGIIITGITRINDEHGPGALCQLSVTKDRHIEPLSRLAQAVQRHGTKIIIQLQHPGREGMIKLNSEPFCTAPSAIECKLSRQPTRALENSEVKQLVQQFIDGAVRVKKAGCDGVEIHAAHGYLINQFLSPYTNKRDDEYGGSFENRMRFITEIITGIREKCGPDFPLLVRLTVDEFLNQTGVKEPYIDLKEGIKIAQALEKLGIDALDVTCGMYETGVTSIEPISFPQGWRGDLVKAVKDSVKLPVIAVSVIREPEVANSYIENGIVDFVASGRSWLADEDWGRKMQEGREKEIRKCISCMHCFGSLMQDMMKGVPFECAVNPRMGREYKYGFEKPDVEGHKAIVVGGGPAGMIAAQTLAMRGTDVTLYEKASELGGAVNLAKIPPHKERMQWVTDYYVNEFERLGVKVELNKEVTAADIEAQSPDAVIIATGALPVVPDTIPGIKNDNVYTVEDVLGGKAQLKDKNIVLVGAGLTGLETAEYLCAAGNKVVIADMVKRPGQGANPTNVGDVSMRLKKFGAKFMMLHSLKEIKADGAVLTNLDTNEDVTVPADAVVLSLGEKPNNALYNELKEKGVDVYVTGNAIRSGVIAPAMRTGYETARNLFVKKEEEFGFVATGPMLKKFISYSMMADQEGLYMLYMTDPDAIKKVLPAPLKPYRMPVVMISACDVHDPSFAHPYQEAVMYILCYFEKQLGWYCASLLLGGAGAEMATQIGRDGGYPKKLGAEFEFKRDGNVAKVMISRRGVQILDAKVEVGEYNNRIAHELFGNPTVGEKQTQEMFLYIYNRKQASMVQSTTEFDYKKWKPGFATIKLQSSVDDAWNDLPVRHVIGGAYCVNDLLLKNFAVAASVPTKEVLAKLIYARYDKSTFLKTFRDEIN